MLDNDTKRKIDSARDILVGKIPDPKAQVEQITTALIYKFMDDMDRESEALGGVAKFIAGELQDYQWAKLMSKGLSGEQRLNTYLAALTAFSQTPRIPEIFRRIFKDAFLPYRDVETLNLFLKEISEFSYAHSENLGDAFEYLLSVLGSQGDAGQFRTPRHIIDFVVRIVKPKKHETILDPACGTAGFLISAYKYILAHDSLEPREKQQLMTNFNGYDISPDMVRLSLVNLYLHHFPQPKVFEYDTLTNEEKWHESFDVILANPPFMTPKGGIRPHQHFRVQAKRSEVLFVDYIAEHLSWSGRAGIIVPEGIIFQSANAYKALRKMLVEEHFLWAVVSLPAGVFQPYSGVKTSVLLLDKSVAKQQDAVIFVKVMNDGFDLGAQRREIAQNDLPRAVALLEGFQRGEAVADPLAVVVAKGKIAESGEFNLTGERYRESKVHYSVFPMVKLGDVCDVRDGTHDSPKYQTEGFPLITSKNIIGGKIDFTNVNLISKEDLDRINKRSLVENGDIIMPMIGTIGNPIIVRKDREFAIKNVALIKFYPDSKINNTFLQAVLNCDYFKQYLDSYSNGVTQKFISLMFIRNLEIPLPPLDVQNAIVEEIEQEQAAIEEHKKSIKMHEAKIKAKIAKIWGDPPVSL